MPSLLSEVSIFQGLSEKEYQNLEKWSSSLSLEKDRFVFRQGDRASHLYIVAQGSVKLFNFRKGSEKEEIVCVIQPQGYFCLAPLLTEDAFHIHAKTLEDTKLMVIQQKTILGLIDRSHVFSKNIIQALAHKECSLCKEVCSLSLATTKERLAQYLLDRYQESKKPFRLNLNQSLLASHLGTVRETLSRDFAAFKRAHILKLKGKQVTILKPEDLAFAAGKFLVLGK